MRLFPSNSSQNFTCTHTGVTTGCSGRGPPGRGRGAAGTGSSLATWPIDQAPATLFNGDLMMMSSRPLPAFTLPLGGRAEAGVHGRLALSLTLEPWGQHFYGMKRHSSCNLPRGP